MWRMAQHVLLARRLRIIVFGSTLFDARLIWHVLLKMELQQRCAPARSQLLPPRCNGEVVDSKRKH
jgi:hypothetical protein